MNNITIEDGRIRFYLGGERYALTPLRGSFFVEKSKGGMLISDGDAKAVEALLKNLDNPPTMKIGRLEIYRKLPTGRSYWRWIRFYAWFTIGWSWTKEEWEANWSGSGKTKTPTE